MVLLQALLTALARASGRVFTTIFGWATITLFGKVSQKKQLFLSAIALVSVIWLVVALGVAFPRVSTVLLIAVPPPRWIDPDEIRVILLIATILLPMVTGLLSLAINDAQHSRGPLAVLTAILRGYPCTLGLALSLFLMLIVVPMMKLRDLSRGWHSAHIPIIVESRDYLSVVEDIQRILAANRMRMVQTRPSWMLRLPIWLMSVFADQSIGRLIAGRLLLLRSPILEIVLYPFDLIVRGREDAVVYCREILAEHLPFTKAHLTVSKEGQHLEDRLKALWSYVQAHPAIEERAIWRQLQHIEEDIQQVKLPYEEWEVLYRQRATLEKETFRRLHRHDMAASGDGTALGTTVWRWIYGRAEQARSHWQRVVQSTIFLFLMAKAWRHRPLVRRLKDSSLSSDHRLANGSHAPKRIRPPSS